jgi:hypothetical protein
MRLLHYSKEPLTRIVSTAHGERACGSGKTPGLWVSVEGEDDWREWCEREDFPIGGLVYEIRLAVHANVLHIKTVDELDCFADQYRKQSDGYWRRSDYDAIDWLRVRADYQGIIIAPYQWARRSEPWYYCWDVASGVIWDADAVESFTFVGMVKPARLETVD